MEFKLESKAQPLPPPLLRGNLSEEGIPTSGNDSKRNDSISLIPCGLCRRVVYSHNYLKFG